MSITHSPTPNGVDVENPNQSVIGGLRDVADWLEQHPELPRVEYASVSFGYEIVKHARERLTRLARALGDRAEEARSMERVTIRGRFGPVTVSGNTTFQRLINNPPIPEPEPILEPKAVTS